MDTSLEQSSIDELLARFVLNMDMFQESILPSELRVLIEVGENMFPLKCKVRKLEPTVHLHLAMDFHFFCPFDLTVNRITINSQKYWRTSHYEDIDYVYNNNRGQVLRRKLTEIGEDSFKIVYPRKI